MKLVISNVSKKIEGKEILKAVSLSLKKGDCLALRGKNGSGKTTLLRIVAGLDKHYSGEVTFTDLGIKNIGYVPQDVVLFEDMTVFDNLSVFGTAYAPGRERREVIERYAEIFHCTDFLRKKTGKLSGGQKRLVNLLCTLINEPSVLLLDESAVGMDEDKADLLAGYLRSVRDQRIIVITSHREDFIEKTCNLHGKLVDGEFSGGESYEKH